MYTEKVTTQDQAICHLLFHCCLKDGRFSASEIDAVSGQLVTAGLHTKMNFKDEVIKYRSYQSSITDETAYVGYLLQLIRPVNELALYNYCLELCLGDASLSLEEEKLLDIIARGLKIPAAEGSVVKKLAAQRKVVETEKVF
jgi:uncharacterized tellurite resistance protein B-like protein